MKEDWWKERQKRQEENRLEEQKEQQDQRTALQPELVHMSGNMLFFVCAGHLPEDAAAGKRDTAKGQQRCIPGQHL